MATIGYEVNRYLKSNGTYMVRLRITHNTTLKYFNSGIYVPKKAVSRNWKVKDKVLNSQICDEIAHYTTQLALYKGDVARCADAEAVYRVLMANNNRGIRQDVDFFDFTEKHINQLRNEGRDNTAGSYQTMINSFKSFTNKRTLLFNEITAELLNDYLKHLGLGRRCASLYLTLIKSVFNAAMRKYNIDEIVIKNPFNNVLKPQTATPAKRALTAEQIRQIAKVTCSGRREQFAKEVFLLSFFLVGINAADLYDCDLIENGAITYYRCKTRTRREDNAKMIVKIPTIAKTLVEKYSDKTKKKVFHFHIRYANTGNFTHAINTGLKSIGKKVGIANLQMYCARHSWATIAATDCKIDIYTIHKALNHSANNLKITETYIRESWEWLDEANNKVIGFVFGENYL